MADLKAALKPHAEKHGWDMSSEDSILTSKHLKKAINCGFVKDRRTDIQEAGRQAAYAGKANQARDQVRNSQTYHIAEVALAAVLGQHASTLFGDIHYTAQPNFEKEKEQPTYIPPHPITNDDAYEDTLRDIKLSKILDEALLKTKLREEQVLRLRFGLEAGTEHSSNLIWKTLSPQSGISKWPETSRVIAAKGIRKLRKNKKLEKAYGKKFPENKYDFTGL